MENSKVKKAVTEQIISMLTNNILNDNGNESFEGWCEDGDVFRYSYPDESAEFYTECIREMKVVASIIDRLTYDFLADF